MNDKLARLVADIDCRTPTDLQLLFDVATARGVSLPEDYIDFLKLSDGGSGDVGAGYVELWPVTQTLQVAENNPPYERFLAFGGDGANTVYGFDATRDSEIVEGDWIGLERDEVIPRGRTFTEFLEGIAEG